MTRQDEQANGFTTSPCHEELRLAALLIGTRAEGLLRKGAAPSGTKDSATDFGAEGGVDALTGN